MTLGSGDALVVVTREDGYRLGLLRGEKLLAALPDTRFSLDRFDALHVDRTGHALLEVQGNTARWIVPVGQAGSHLVVLQGGLENDLALYGDNNTDVADENHDGVLDVVVGSHSVTATGLRSSRTTYRWNGTRYAKVACSGDLC